MKIEDLAEEYVTKMSHRNEKRVLKNPLMQPNALLYRTTSFNRFLNLSIPGQISIPG